MPEIYLIHTLSSGQQEQIMQVWEESVRATHDFLHEEDIQCFIPFVHEATRAMDYLFCTFSEDAVITGFMGILHGKIEMLFIAPTMRGKGLGKALVQLGLQQCGVQLVDVNEQNMQARGFYERMGFVVFARSERDSAGKPYPILQMQLEPFPLK